MTRQIRAATAGAAAGGWRHGLVWRWLSEGSAGSPRSGLSVAGSSWRAPFGDRSPCNAQQGVILDDQISRMGEALAGQGGGWSRGGQLSGVAADVPRARWVWLSRASGQRCVSFSSARAGWWQTGGRRSRWQSGGWRDYRCALDRPYAHAALLQRGVASWHVMQPHLVWRRANARGL